MKRVVLLSAVLLAGCGAKSPEQQANVPDPNPPTQPLAKSKVEPTKATLTPGMEAAQKAHDAGNYGEAVRLYTIELATEEAKPAPSWVQLSYLNNQLGLALKSAGQYDRALEYYQKSLAIQFKKLEADHPDVADSYNNIGALHDRTGEYDKALEYYQKSLAIQFKKLGADHPDVAVSYNNIGAIHDRKGEYD
jgi:tetratricopeptide (TPR) repeat protein